MPLLDRRPMHADEAILADKLGTLLATGAYPWDPAEYHGPILGYLGWISAHLSGRTTYTALTETTLRAAPAVAGILLALSPLLLAPAIGRRDAIAACAWIAVSPVMVYYSRYYIPEIPLALWTALFLAAVLRGWWPAAGAAAVLMIATKETAVLSLAAAGMAWVAAFRPRFNYKAIGVAAAGLALFLAVAWKWGTLAQSVASYLARGTRGGIHAHPWYTYFGWLVGESPILLLGLAAAWRSRARLGMKQPSPRSLGSPLSSAPLAEPRPKGGPDGPLRPTKGHEDAAGAGRVFSPVLRRFFSRAVPKAATFLAIYAVVLIAIYSALPYKTPWCAVSLVYPLALLAGMPVDALRGRWRILAAAAIVCLAVEAWAASFPYAADPRNPWVYAHTGDGVFTIRERIAGLARAAPQRDGVPIDVYSRENLWPLPWYFRRYPNVRWWRDVAIPGKAAPIVLASPAMEPDLVRKLYEGPPPGERELYMNLFPAYLEIRPQVEIRGYVAKSLWDLDSTSRN